MTRKQMILAHWQIFTIGGRRMRIRGGAPFKVAQAQTFTPGDAVVAYAVVDVGLELTLPELADRMNWFRCYADLMPKRRPTFDWDYWRKYYVAKFGTKPVGGEVLDSIGQVIADGHRPEFVSATVLKELELCG